jgi:NhaP-type Na+/H+ or K+/H+ antiporter
MDPLLSIGLWVVLAFAMALFPSNDNHWRRAYVLIAIGVPLLVWIFLQHGVFMGVLGLVVGGLVLRWPVYFFWRWIQQKMRGQE